MAKKAPKTTAKARVINVRLLSMAMTGFFYVFTRPRTSLPMSMIKYDPIGTRPGPPKLRSRT
ncbi:hypothetical protein BT67DRAFT_441362 [Trichocladium antarcticum]|uniref:Large ribosomal subunit protein bL33m n=1 Tax=Trichocladium antarcticum TaxID=1450529 RepID=A0AAN6ULR4_9PEZI|nr:hypothetical protein BT67DRAFT_441362 [Trichocladium antarcticum]